MDSQRIQAEESSFDRAELLRKLLKKKGIRVQTAQGISRRKQTGPCRLSYAQQRMWFLQQLNPASPAYNLCNAIRVRGQFDAGLLRLALSEIMRRHEALRTAFRLSDGIPQQVINPAEPINLPVIDLSSLPDEEREIEIRHRAAEEASRPFDLAEGPLLRVGLLELSAEDRVVLFTMHHIVSDGWSMDVLIRELTLLYQAFVAGSPSPLGDLPIQYSDFSEWQRDWLQGDVLNGQLDFWKGQLAGIPQSLELPTDRPRSAQESFEGGSHSFVLPERLYQSLKVVCEREDATPFMVLLGTFQTLLSRYSGQTDIVVGSSVANRNRAQIEGLIGFFVNTLVLRADLSANPTFKDLIRQVRDTVLKAYDHQDLPFEKIVDELNPERSRNTNPLFQVGFSLHHVASQTMELPRVTLSPVKIEGVTAKFDLSLEMFDSSQGITGLFVYKKALFDASTIARMADHFLILLGGMIEDVRSRVLEARMTSESEREQVIERWNDTRRDYASTSTLQDLFERQARRTPDKVAVEVGHKRLTFRELDEQANRIANYLRSVGVGPETLVGLCVERSTEMVAGALGIMKAGGAYIPLDPGYPLERLTYILEHARAAVLLTQEHLRAGLPADSAQVVCLDSDHERIAQQSSLPPPVERERESLAYVIYTSGSTGKPKGVQIPHQALVNFLCSMQQSPGLREQDVLLAVTPLSFDIAGLEIYLPLIIGAKLVIATQAEAYDSGLLADKLASARATVMQATPATWRMLLESGWQGSKQLCVLCGGEAITEKLAASLLQANASVWNMYGPTETTIWSTIENLDIANGPISIGRPIANTEIYILDESLNPVPIGVPGELHIGGDGLARGYLDRADLTADKFIPNQFGNSAGARLYKTGDLARYLEDGRIECLGRADYQVKVRGHRIELGDIEAALDQHPLIQACAVTVRKDERGDNRLVAYMVCDKNNPLTITELRDYLKGKLPDYMLPSLFVKLDALPLTPNGKVDRRSLPAPDESRPEMKSRFVMPNTLVERELAGMWSEILGVAEVGMRDNFFELGGHSLLLTRLHTRLAKSFNVHLNLRDLFDAPTVTEMIAVIAAKLIQQHEDASAQDVSDLTPQQRESAITRLRNKSAAQGEPEAPAILPVSRDKKLSLSFAQQRLWFLHQLNPSDSSYNLAVAFRLTGQLDIPVLDRTLNEIINRHEILRTTFQSANGDVFQVISPTARLTLDITDLSGMAEPDAQAKVAYLTAEEARRPFDLATGPLMRASLVKLGEKSHIVLFTMHHVISDGWSMGVLVREVKALYQAFSEGKEPDLKPLLIQYADYAGWQRQYLKGEVLHAQLGYWKKQLSGIPARLELPTDHPRPQVQTFRGDQQDFILSSELTESLKALSRAEGVTLFMTLLAAFQTLLHRYTGAADIAVGTPIAGRNRIETEDLIGLFVNTLVMRSDLSRDPEFSGLLKRVREMTLAAYANQDVPFEKIVEEVRPERSLGHTPLFQVLFALQNVPASTLEMQGLSLNAVRRKPETTKFDLSLYMEEREGQLFSSLQYSADLFEAQSVERIAAQFQTLLASIVEDPQRRLSSLSISGHEQREELLSDFNEDF